MGSPGSPATYLTETPGDVTMVSVGMVLSLWHCHAGTGRKAANSPLPITEARRCVDGCVAVGIGSGEVEDLRG